jgi:uncharacterized membrane protein YhaH (DUF805 family)
MREYLTPQGRINRAKYFAASIILFSAGWVIGDFAKHAENPALLIIGLAVMVLLTYIDICLKIKRAHDLDKSWMHVLLLLVPLFNIYVYIKLLIERGTGGDNYYGEDPLIALAKYK